jgi:hypothetical protein
VAGRSGNIFFVTAAAGDRGDGVTLNTSTFSRVTGGSGNDVLRSITSIRQAGLSGNDGNHTMDGGIGFDNLDGGPGFEDLCDNAEVTVNCEGF